MSVAPPLETRSGTPLVSDSLARTHTAQEHKVLGRMLTVSDMDSGKSGLSEQGPHPDCVVHGACLVLPLACLIEMQLFVVPSLQ